MKSEGWTAVEVVLPLETKADDVELDVMSGVLFELGAQGIETLDQARPLKVIAAFPPEVESGSLVSSVESALSESHILYSSVSKHEYEPIDWSTHWRSHFRPLDFGKLWVVPSWEQAPSNAGHVLWLDPSRAFGTGLHATTSLCLHRVLELSPVGSILDVGTGTGILAFASLKVGTERAVGVDNDPEALEVAEENARYNGLSQRIELRLDMPSSGAFDLVVANILARPLMELADVLSKSVKPGGHLLLSGILREQVEDLLAAYQNSGLERAATRTQEEWAMIDLVRR